MKRHRAQHIRCDRRAVGRPRLAPLSALGVVMGTYLKHAESGPRPAPPAVTEASPAPLGDVTALTSPAPSAVDAPIDVRFSRVAITRALEADLTQSVGVELGAPLAQVVKRVLVWWIDPRRDLRRGDRLDVVWSPRTAAEPSAWAIWLDSQKLREERAAVLYRAQGARCPRWVDPDGVEVALRLRDGPIEGYELVTALVNDGRGHRGVDFRAPEGTPIVAPFSGRVKRINWRTRANGRCVALVDARTGREASFLHLSRIAPGIRPGVEVRRGQRLGRVGNTGRSFAPHLHYQLERNGRLLDPFRVHDTWRARLGDQDRQVLQARLLMLDALRTDDR